MSSIHNDKAKRLKHKNRRGRPSRKQQIEIEETIWYYFEKGVCAAVASQESKINRKTVDRYYEKLAELPLRTNEKAFINQCKINIASAETAISNQLLKLRQIQDKLLLFMSKGISAKDYLNCVREFRKLAKTIAELIVLKTNLANSPTSDLTLNRLAQEWTQNNAT